MRDSDFDIEIRIDSKYFKSFMKEMKVTVSNMSPPFKEYGRYIKKETEQQFIREITPDGKLWAPLKPATLKRKKTPFKLRETFQMSRSFYVEVTKNSMSYQLKDEKYRFHHFGTEHMAARVVIGDTQERRGVLNKMIIGYLRTKRAGKKK